jgi:hypothetical protein
MKRTAVCIARIAGLTAAVAAVLVTAAMLLTAGAEAQAPLLIPMGQTQEYCVALQDAWAMDFAVYQSAPNIEAKQAAWQSLQGDQQDWYDAMCAHIFGDIGYLPKEPLAYY